MTHSAGLPTASTYLRSSSLTEVDRVSVTADYFLVNLLLLCVSQKSQPSFEENNEDMRRA